MNPSPIKELKEPSYPSSGTYAECYRRFAVLAAATILGGSAVCASSLNAQEKAASPATTEITVDKAMKLIAELAGKLGDQDFNVRQDSTMKLIELGKTKDKDGKLVFKDLVVEEMKKLCASKDPEAKGRAKQVIVAVNPELPPKKKPMRPDNLVGDIAL
jgi:hypothetical protein